MQGYRIDWTYISEADINKLDEEGKIYLFQIYNKDFAENSTGKENLHTMYFKNIFSEENLKNIVIKLNGQAELFYRKASVKNPVKHRNILIKSRSGLPKRILLKITDIQLTNILYIRQLLLTIK